MKKGFSLGPQAAAKSLASRLRIDRKPTATRPAITSSLRSTSSLAIARADSASSSATTAKPADPTSTSGVGGSSGAGGPLEIDVQSATPVPEASTLLSGKTDLAQRIESARAELKGDAESALGASPPEEVARTPKALQAIQEVKESPVVPEAILPPTT